MSERRGRERTVVAVMTRFPRIGEVKTRLAPALGEDGAARLHRELAAHCVARLRPLHATREARIEVHVEGGSLSAARDWLGGWPRYIAQGEGDLGDRLRAALSRAFATGAESALVMGSDCPAARATHVREALRALEAHDTVIGPAADGGYWLLGVRAEVAPRALDALFAGIGWGGPDVFRQTMLRADGASLRVAVAHTLADVDRPADVALWEAERLAEGATPTSLSVVIPALNEAGRVGAAVSSALDGGASEVIVVDGGSSDATREVAEAAGARVLRTAPGRATQMNAGAAAAAGDALLFLHADTRLPAGFAATVLGALADRETSGGAFMWGTDDTSLSSFHNLVGRARMAVFRIPYGDQALFLRRRTFEDLGGYPVQPIMEDWELAVRLGKQGKVRILPQRALTSSRRWTEGGLIGPSVMYLAIIAAYRMGVDPALLDSWRRS